MKKLFFASMALCAGLLFVSCSEDENGGPSPSDPVSGASVTNKSDLATKAGLLVKQIGDYSFGYDNKNRVVSVRYKDYGFEESITLDYEKGLLYWGEEPYTVKFNKDGYITEIAFTWEENYGKNEMEKVTYSQTFVYDTNGHMISSKCKEIYTEIYDGETYTESFDATYSLTWENGNLLKAVCDFKEIEDDEYYNEKSNSQVSYSTKSNQYLQMLAQIDEVIDMDIDGVLYATGLFGKGAKNLPSSVISTFVEYEDGDVYSSEEHIKFEFTQNSNNTIASEKVCYLDEDGDIDYDRDAVSYTYIPTSSVERMQQSSVYSTPNDTRAAKPIGKLLRRHSRRR